MTHYTVSGTCGTHTPFKVSATAKDLEEMRNDPFYTIVSVVEHVPNILYTTAPNCERCTWDEYVPHFNCMYHGNAVGHSNAHCTASACY